MQEFRTKKPKYIINKIKYPQIEPYLSKVKPYRREMYNYIRKNYKRVKNFGNIDILISIT